MRTKTLKISFIFSAIYMFIAAPVFADCGGSNQGLSIRTVACVINSVSEFDTTLYDTRGESPIGTHKEMDYFVHRTQVLKPIQDKDLLDIVQFGRQEVLVQLKF